jgi:hypothetical protein
MTDQIIGKAFFKRNWIMRKLPVVLFVFLALITSTNASFNLQLSEMLRTRGQYYDLAISQEPDGDKLYVASKLGIEVYSLSNPANPELEAFFSTPGLANGIAVNYPYVYVGDVYGFSIWDVSDINSPVMRSAIKTDRVYGYQERLYYRNGLVYVAAYSNGIQIIDVKDPDNPVLVGHTRTDAYAWDMALTEDAAYIMDFFSMAIIDIRRPEFPMKRKTMDKMFASGAAIRDNLLYLGYVDGLAILDISDPFDPTIISDWGPTGSGTAQTVSLLGNYACVGHGNYIEIYDISNVFQPVQISYFFPPGNPRKILAHNGYLYTVLDDAGYLVTNISDPGNPVQETHVNTGVWGTRLNVIYNEGLLYLVDWSRGLVIYDTGQPDGLVELHTYSVPGSLRYCVIEGNHAYLVGQGEIQIVDVSDPENPEFLGNFHTSGRPYHVSVDTELSRLYMCDLYGFFILDISDPSNIQREGAIWLAKEGNPYASEVIGSYAFVANGWKGMKIIDISDPANPQLVHVWPGDNSKSYVMVQKKGGYLYFLNPSRGIDIMDVSEPLDPQLSATIPFDDGITVNDFVLKKNLLFLAAGINGVFVYDIQNPAEPVLVGYADTPGDTLGVEATDEIVFVADRYNLSVYDRLPFEPDYQLPAVSIVWPEFETLVDNKTLVVRGTSEDEFSGVQKVQISTDGGESWGDVFGQTVWSTVVSGHEPGPFSVRARAIDWSGNISEETDDVWCYFNPPAPQIFVAGIDMSHVVAGEISQVILSALVHDPWDENYIGDIDLYLNDLPVDYTVLEYMKLPGYLYLQLMFEQIFYSGEQPDISLIVNDYYNNPSHRWPKVPSRW